MKVNVTVDIDQNSAFQLLCKELSASTILDDDFLDKYSFSIDDFDEIVVIHKESGEIFDDRGELYLALLHLATKIFPNVGFRKEMDDPRCAMSNMYLVKEEFYKIEEEVNDQTN